MKFGMFEEFHVRDGEPQSQAFDEHFHQVDMAEKMGLDSVWLASTTSLLSAPFWPHHYRSGVSLRPVPKG